SRRVAVFVVKLNSYELFFYSRCRDGIPRIAIGSFLAALRHQRGCLGKVAFHRDALMTIHKGSDPVLDDSVFDGQRTKNLESAWWRGAKIARTERDYPSNLEFVRRRHSVLTP